MIKKECYGTGDIYNNQHYHNARCGHCDNLIECRKSCELLDICKNRDNRFILGATTVIEE